MLRQLLEKVRKQVTNNQFTYSLIIVDNDSNRSAENIVFSFKEKSSINVDYYCENQQNISLARNMAIQNAKGDFIALIDDDEFPDDDWLLNLLKASQAMVADGIQGPVIPYFNEDTPRWVIAGKFYERPYYPTGLILDWRQGRTGNLLLNRKMVEENKIMFDPKFGSGGEDQDFFRRMIAKGYVFKYCSEAKVYEFIPPVRWEKKFMIKRALLRGKVAILHPSFNLFSIVRSAVAVPLYTVLLPLFLIFGKHMFMKYLVKDFDHIGKILAFCGIDVIKEKYITE